MPGGEKSKYKKMKTKNLFYILCVLYVVFSYFIFYSPI